MVLQSILWAALASCLGGVAYGEVKKRKSYRQVDEGTTEEPRDFSGPYTKLFENLGVMDQEKGDWIKCYGITDKDCYRVLSFKLSDSLSYKDFVKIQDKIAEKLHVPERLFSIETKKGYMYFRIVHEKLPIVTYRNHKLPKNLLPTGYDLDNQLQTIQLTSDPNILIGGVPTSGKTTMLHGMILHIIENNSGLLWLIDYKAGLELGRYRNLKQVRGFAKDLEPSKAIVQSFNEEMERRFALLEAADIQKYEDYIEKFTDKDLPRCYLIIDEFADAMKLIPKGKDKEKKYNIIDALVTIGRKCRCVGMHVILASQGLNSTSLDPNIKRVCSSIIGFRAVNSINSIVIIDEAGLEELSNHQAIVVKEGRKVLVRTMLIDKSYRDDLIAKNKGPKKIEPVQEIHDGDAFKKVV